MADSQRAAAAFVDAEAPLWAVTPADRVLSCRRSPSAPGCEEMWLAGDAG